MPIAKLQYVESAPIQWTTLTGLWVMVAASAQLAPPAGTRLTILDF